MSAPIFIGIGCRRQCPADEIEALVRRALARVQEAPRAGLFTSVDKSGEAGLIEAADRLGLALAFLPRQALCEQAARVRTPSPRAQRLFGVPSVAEAAALAGAGPGAVLLVPRITSGGAACAIAAASAGPA